MDFFRLGTMPVLPLEDPMNAPVIRMGTMPVLPLGLVAESVWAMTYRATTRNITRLKEKIRRLKSEIKTASPERKSRLRKRIDRAQRRLERIERVVRRRIEKRKARGKELTARQKRLRAALRRNKKDGDNAEKENADLAAALDSELADKPDYGDAADTPEDAEPTPPAVKPFYRRPEILAGGAILGLALLYAVTRK